MTTIFLIEPFNDRAELDYNILSMGWFTDVDPVVRVCIYDIKYKI